MASESYKDKLRDRRWQQRKSEIIARDNYECQNASCNHKQDHKAILNVHHIFYFDADPWNYPDDMLVTLCENCHSKEHSNRSKEEQALLDCLRLVGFLYTDLYAMACILYMNLKERKRWFKLVRKFQK